MNEVKNLHGQQGKYDLMFKGQKIAFDVRPSGLDAFLLEYYGTYQVPEHLKGIMPGRYHIACRLITLKWWEKLFGVSLEKKLGKETRKFNADMKRSFEISGRVEGIKDALNHETL
jgi:hypothetical protein